MEIISYVNKSSTRTYRQTYKSTLSLDELLYRQRTNRRQSQHKIDFADLQVNLAFFWNDILESLKKT